MINRYKDRSVNRAKAVIAIAICIFLSLCSVPFLWDYSMSYQEKGNSLKLLETASSKPQNFSTYIGGSSDDMAYDMAADNDGNLYIAGSTPSEDFPVTEGSFNETYGGNTDGYVCKLSADGSSLMWCTYIGGPMADLVLGIAVLDDGSVIVCGETRSGSFPTTDGAYGTTHSGGSDAFIAKLSADGSQLLFSTLIGGSQDDVAEDVDIDSTGVVGVAIETNSPDFPISAGAYNSTFGTNVDIAVVELSSNGQSLLYSSYFGAGDFDGVTEIEYSDNDEVIILGRTGSAMFPVTSGAYDETFDAGTYDGFLSKFNLDGSELSFSTFIGGSNLDFTYSFEIDSVGDIIIHGKTYSDDFPVSPSAYDTKLNGSTDAFLFKLKNDGTSMIASSLYGGNGAESGGSLSIDSQDRLFFTGITDSTDLNITDNAMQKNLLGTYDIFISEFSSDLTDLVYGTYIGSSGTDTPYWSCIDDQGYFNVVGYSNAADFPTTDGAFNETHSGGRDVVVIKFPRYPVEDGGFPYWIIIVVVGVASAAIISFLIIQKRKNKK